MSSAEEILYKYLRIPYGSKVVTEFEPAIIQQKTFDQTNNFPNVVSFFVAGSNSTGNVLRYLSISATVATASGEPENNVSLLLDYDIILKRVRYIIGSNTKNNATNISFRINGVDLPESVVTIDAGQSFEFDSGLLDIEIPKNTKMCWKWDTSGCSSGGVTVLYLGEYEVKLTAGSNAQIPQTAQPILFGLSTDQKPTVNVPQYSEYLEIDTLEKYVIINGIWYNLNMSFRKIQLYPEFSFQSNKVLTSVGYADFIHWVEPILKSSKVVVPFSFLNAGTSGGIAISDDGINTREVFKSVKANENFWLCAKDRGDLCLVGSGSGGANVVGSVYRSQDYGETWTEILSNTDIRVYGIEFTTPTRNCIIVTSAGGVPATSGKIMRSQNISVGSPTFTTIQTLTEGGRCVKNVEQTGTVLVGTGHANGAGIWRSTNEGTSFTKVKTFTSTEGQNCYWIQDYYDPLSNKTKIFAFLSSGKVYQSLDDGATWSLLLAYKNYTSSPVRRITQFSDLLIAANDDQGLSVFDPIRGKLNPVNNETYANSSGVPFYNIAKYNGALVGSMAYNLLYSGKINPCTFNLWSAKAIADTTNGDVTVPFSSIGHSPLNNSVGIYSNQSGTLTVQVYDPIGNAWRDHTSTVAITANTLKLLSFVEAPMSARASNYWRIKFVPSVACSINIWVNLN